MISVVVPTFKEADNLPALTRAVDAVMKSAGFTYELIIADDASPDDTPAVVESLSAEFPIRLVLPEGRGPDLSLSVIDGARAARFNRVVVMDADLSHPPEAIRDMMAVLDKDERRFVIGSRYISGGGFDRDWSIWRFLNSHFATLLAKPLVPCSDPMSGFLGFDRRFVDLDRLRPIGYKIGLELMVRGEFSGVDEVAIQFKDREIGESKMNLGQQLKYIRHLRRLYVHRLGNLGEFLQYGLVGASGFVVDIIFYYLLQFLGLHHQVARAISFWPAVSWNWALNRRTAFGDRERRPKGKQWAEFVVASLVGFTINWGVYAGLTTYVAFFDEWRLLALIAGIGIASVFNFAASTLFVYSEKRQ